MLQKIRDNTSGWIAVLILVPIMFAMAFFGLDSLTRSDMDSSAAKIERAPAWWTSAPDWWLVRKLVWEVDSISTIEFTDRLNRVRSETQQAQGDSFDAEAFLALSMKREILERMIDERLVNLAAKDAGIRASKSQIRNRILEIDGLTENGKFVGKEAYQAWLQVRGYTGDSFDAEIAGAVVSSSLVGTMGRSAIVTDAELDEFLRLQRQTRDISALIIEPPFSAPEISEEQIQAHYENNPQLYSTVETVAIDYVELDVAAMPTTGVVAEEDLLERYEQNPLRFGRPAEKTLSQILIEVSDFKDAAIVAAAQARAETVVQRARAGEDFAALAREFSDDSLSRELGGDIGVYQPGIFPSEFDAPVASLAESEVSDPIRTQQGLHVVFVREVLEAQSQPFEEVRDQLATEYLESERERTYSELGGALIDKILLDPTSLRNAASELNIEVYSSGMFTRESGEGIAALDEVRKVAFAAEQLQERKVSQNIELGVNHMVILQVREHKPSVLRPFDEVRDQVAYDLESKLRSEEAKARAMALLERAQSGTSMTDLATEISGSVASVSAAARGSAVPHPAVVAQAFSLPRPAAVEGDPAIALADMGNNRFALVSVSAVQDGDAADTDETVKGLLKTQLAQLRGQLEAQAFIDALRSTYKITVNESRL